MTPPVDAFLPAAGTAALTVRRDRQAHEAALALQPLDALGLRLRGAGRVLVGDLDLQLLPPEEGSTGLLVSLQGIGGAQTDRLDSIVAGWVLGPAEISAGLGVAPRSGGGSTLMLGAVRLPIITDRFWASAAIRREGGDIQPRLETGWRPLPMLELGGGWHRGRGPFAALSLHADLSSLSQPWPLPGRKPGHGRWTEVTSAMGAADAVAVNTLAGMGDTIATHRLGLPGISARMLPGQVLRAGNYRGSGAEIRRTTRFERAARPEELDRHWGLTADLIMEAGPGPDASDWALRGRGSLGLTLIPTSGLVLYLSGQTARLRPATWPVAPGPDAGRSDIQHYSGEALERAGVALPMAVTPAADLLLEAGLLEEMFAGYGGELRLQPPLARWSLGLEAHQLWKRQPTGFGRPLVGTGRRTGLLTAGWEGPAAESRFTLSSGRFLAGDWGGQITASRWFGTGLAITGAVTVTGTGGRMGLGLTLPLGTLADRVDLSARVRLQPLARDGGQRLERAFTLADLRRDAGYGRLLAGWDRAFTSPDNR